MLLTFRNSVIGSLTALALAAGTVAPANAFGKGERGFVKGAAAAVIVGTVIHEVNRRNQLANGGVVNEGPVDAYRTDAPVYRQEHRRGNGNGHRRHYREPVYQAPVYAPAVRHAPRYIQPTYRTSIYATPAAQAFNSYSYRDRQAIQRRLARGGFYKSSVDGSFGPGTYNAIVSFAQSRNRSDALATQSGALAVMDRILS